MKKSDFRLDVATAFPDYVTNDIFSPIIEYTDRDKRVLFFGDSFVNVGAELNWTRQICHKLNRQSLNYGRGGSSLLFSINNFFKYIETDYREDDYIVFVTTSHTRFPKVHPSIDPGISAAFMNYCMEYWPTVRDDIKYFDYHTSLVSWLANVYCNQEDFRHQCIMIDNYLKNMKNKTALIPAFHVKYWDITNKFCLYDVSELTNYKAPINHMTVEQNMILADQTIEYFETQSFDVFDLEAYK